MSSFLSSLSWSMTTPTSPAVAQLLRADSGSSSASLPPSSPSPCGSEFELLDSHSDSAPASPPLSTACTHTPPPSFNRSFAAVVRKTCNLESIPQSVAQDCQGQNWQEAEEPEVSEEASFCLFHSDSDASFPPLSASTHKPCLSPPPCNDDYPWDDFPWVEAVDSPRFLCSVAGFWESDSDSECEEEQKASEEESIACGYDGLDTISELDYNSDPRDIDFATFFPDHTQYRAYGGLYLSLSYGKSGFHGHLRQERWKAEEGVSAGWLPPLRVRHRHLDIPHYQPLPQHTWYARRFDFHPMRPSSTARAYYTRSQSGSIERLRQGARSKPAEPKLRSRWETSDAPIPNPYDASPDQPAADSHDPKKKRRGTSERQHGKAQQRNHNNQQKKSTVSMHRPIMQRASNAHRQVLEDRAQRKLKHKQKQAARPLRLPKHLRPRSAPSAPSSSPSFYVPRPPSSRPSFPPNRQWFTRDARTFSDFRHNFFRRHQQSIENAFGTGGLGGRHVAEIRLCPINGRSRYQFMQKLQQLRPREEDIRLVYHVTRLRNMQSICDRGLLIPNPSVNGVSVAHGTSMGLGIYTSLSASHNLYYTDGNTLLVCAALTKGAAEYSYGRTYQPPATVSGDMVVLRQEERVCPLFLLDFKAGRGGGDRGLSQKEEPPSASTKYIRWRLHKAYTQQSKGRSGVRMRGTAEGA